MTRAEPRSAELLDKPLAVLLEAEVRAQGIRPSVLHSDFFAEYSLRRLLENPEDAYYGLCHTRGIGDTTRVRVVDVIAAKLRETWPEAWDVATRGPITGKDDPDGWPHAPLRGFVRHWLEDAHRIPRPKVRQARS